MDGRTEKKPDPAEPGFGMSLEWSGREDLPPRTSLIARGCFGGSAPTEHHVDAGEDELEVRRGDPANTLGQGRAVKRHEL